MMYDPATFEGLPWEQQVLAMTSWACARGASVTCGDEGGEFGVRLTPRVRKGGHLTDAHRRAINKLLYPEEMPEAFSAAELKRQRKAAKLMERGL